MKAKRVFLKLLLVVMATGFAASAGAAMYKWTDKQGNVHYTQEPPVEGDATEIAAPKSVTPPPPSKVADKKKAEEERNDAEGDKPLTPEQQEVYRRNCEAARANIETYKKASRIQQPDGEIVEMDEQNRQKKMQQAEEQMKKFCR